MYKASFSWVCNCQCIVTLDSKYVSKGAFLAQAIQIRQGDAAEYQEGLLHIGHLRPCGKAGGRARDSGTALQAPRPAHRQPLCSASIVLASNLPWRQEDPHAPTRPNPYISIVFSSSLSCMLAISMTSVYALRRSLGPPRLTFSLKQSRALYELGLFWHIQAPQLLVRNTLDQIEAP